MRWILLFCLPILGYACTDFVVVTKDRTFVNGRSLEFAMDLQSKLKVFPRNQKMSSQGPDRRKGTEWVSKYGYLGVTAMGMNFSMDGLNEMGLSFGLLWLPGWTQYPTVAPEEMKKALDFVDLGAWLLGNFATVAEIKEGLKGVRIWGHPVPPLPGIPPVHVAIHDAKGNHLVLEFIKGEVKVYDNPNTVLTNSPPFDWHVINLDNYINLNALNAGPVNLNGMVLNAPGQGSGLLGIPGDWTPPSRFVRMTTFLRFAEPANDAAGGINLAEHLLNTVDIPIGEVQDPNAGGDYTQWVVIKDLTHRVFYFRSYYDLCLKMVDMKKLNFDTGSGSKTVSLTGSGKGYMDVTSALRTKESTTALRESDRHADDCRSKVE